MAWEPVRPQSRNDQPQSGAVPWRRVIANHQVRRSKAPIHAGFGVAGVQAGQPCSHHVARPCQAKPIQRRTPAWAHRSVLARRRASLAVCPPPYHTCARSPAVGHARPAVPCLNARSVTCTPARSCAAAHARTRTPIHPMCEDHTDSWVGSHGLHLISNYQYLIITIIPINT